MNESIIHHIDAISATMQAMADLREDVAPFMATTLAKIKHLASINANNQQAQHELEQMATKYLPGTINAYCALPIEYRNTRIIKADKTARELLIDDLKIFKRQASEIEALFYEDLESQIKVNSSFVRNKYESQFQLANEVQHLADEGFVNQFNFSQYKDSPEYRDIVFKHLSPHAKPTQVNKESLSMAQKSMKELPQANHIAAVFHDKLSLLMEHSKKPFTKLLKIIQSLSPDIKGLIVMGGAVACILVAGIAAIVSVERPRSLLQAVQNSSKSIYDVMTLQMIPAAEFVSFVQAKQDELIDGSSYRAQRIKLVYTPGEQAISLNVADLSRQSCQQLIDHKEHNTDGATLRVNGLNLVQDNTVSNYNYLLNDNHRLCHLSEGNRVAIELHNASIHAQQKSTLSASEKEVKLQQMQKEIDLLEREKAQANPENALYRRLGEMIDKVKRGMQELKGQKD